MIEIADIKRIPMSGIGSGMPSCVELCQIFRIHQAKCQMLIHKALYVQEVVIYSNLLYKMGKYFLDRLYIQCE